MTSSPARELPEPPSKPDTLAAPVAVAVLAIEGESLGPTLEAIARQVYEPHSIFIIADKQEVTEAGEGELTVTPTMHDLVSTLDSAVSFVWILHGDARPRPDALRALVAEVERHEAAVAGSKILYEGEEDRLESIGAATDVFGEPYGGLDEDEVDLEQYDVVRDVAFVSSVSALVRRDLLRGLGGIDRRLAPQAAGLDLSQRARLAGGRVIVVPSSEVFHRGFLREDPAGWREWAGRMRAMIKAYRLVTLGWVIPVSVLVVLADTIVQALLGRWKILPRFLAAAGWNLWNLPSTVVARRGVRLTRLVGDEELFRYQVTGSVRLREAGSELAERITTALDDSEPGLAGRARQLWTRPGILAGLGVVAVILLATRNIWLGSVPVAGEALPLAASATDTLRGYAGGWNPAGLGSDSPMPAGVGVAAVVQLIVGNQPGLAQTLITIVAVLAAAFGGAALVRALGMTGPARHAAGLVYAGGLAMGVPVTNGAWPAMVAGGVFPWALVKAIEPWPSTLRNRIGRLAAIALPAGLATAFLPPIALVLLTAAIVWGLVSGRMGIVLRAAAGTVVGVGLLGPSLVRWQVESWFDGGAGLQTSVEWLWPLAVGAGALLVVLLCAPPRPEIAGWAGLLALGGWTVGRLPDLGDQPQAAAWIGAALGEAAIVATLLTFGGSRWVRVGALVPAAVLVAPVFLFVASGRAWLPPDAWGQRLEFARALSDDPGAERLLMVGPADGLPGGSYSLAGTNYRVLAATGPTFDQARLPPATSADISFEQTLADLGSAQSIHPGELLAPYGIRWVVLVGDSPFDEALARQVDLAPRPLDPQLRIYENLAELSPAETGQPTAEGLMQAAAMASLILTAGLIVLIVWGRK
jgi:GT2 family glycosyltransferase